MKRKKFWIIFGVIFCVVLVLSLVLTLGFRLKRVDVEFLSRENPTKLEEGILDKVKRDGDFDYGKNLFTLKLDSSIQKIEKANPYIKVSSTRKVFANTVRIYLIERTPEYRVQEKENSENWFILDNEFKILDTVTSEQLSSGSEFYSSTIEISPSILTISSSEYSRGDFVLVANGYDTYLGQISDGIYGRTQNSSAAHSIEAYANADGSLSFIIYMRKETAPDGRGCKIRIDGVENLKEKVYVGVSAFMQETSSDSALNDSSNTILITLVNGTYKGTLSKDEI